MYELVSFGEFVPNRFLQSIADIIAKNLKLFPKLVLELKTKYQAPSVVAGTKIS